MSFNAHVLTESPDSRGNRVQGRQSIGGGKTLEQAREVANAHLEDNPDAKEIVLVNGAGAEVERVKRDNG